MNDALLSLPIFQSEWVLYLLLILSVVSIGVIIERFFFYNNRKVDTALLRRDLAKHLERGDYRAAAAMLEKQDTLETNAVLAGLKAYERGPESVEELMSGALGLEKSRYERRLGFLATIASNAPYIGLFGTVLGIIKAFKDLSENMTDASTSVMAGVSEALLATAIGLLVAIPAVIAYNVFKGRVKTSATECEMLARIVLSSLKAEPAREPGA